jgi:hypothetical protein
VYDLICIEPKEARRRSQAAWKQKPVWRHIQGEKK